MEQRIKPSDITGRTVIVFLAGDSTYDGNKTSRPEGLISEVEPSPKWGKKYVNYKSQNYLDIGEHQTTQSCFRLATEKETAAYKRGIRWIHEIPTDEIINNYETY